MKSQEKIKRQLRRKTSVKSKIFGTASRPRLSVFRSNQYIYAQLVDDEKAQTLVSASSIEKDAKTGKMNKVDSAALVGENLAKKAVAKKVKLVTFDRNGFKYHGRVKSLAEGARKGGLQF